MALSVPTFREIQDRIGTLLREQGGLGVILMDLAPLARIERSFGGSTYQALRAQIDPLMIEIRDQLREGDLLARDEREGDRYLIFCGGRPTKEKPFAAADLRSLAKRADTLLTPRIARLTQPYFRERPDLQVGYGFVIHSPLESQERQLQRLIDEAHVTAGVRRQLRERDEREGLLEVIYNQRLWTAFQPIVSMTDRSVMAHEGLSRGPRGSELEAPMSLFGLAARHHLIDELERACRRQGFIDWEKFGSPGRLFMNTVPATVRDTSFMGRGVLDYLGARISPNLVTLEITEREAIENLSLYREAMHAFLDLGFTFAIDDVGAGYSGLETIASLGATYLKIDMSLVRGVHEKRVSQQVVKAILDMGTGVGATIIAEGIQTEEEAEALMGLGVRYGQGYLFARPIDPYSQPTPVPNRGGIVKPASAPRH